MTAIPPDVTSKLLAAFEASAKAAQAAEKELRRELADRISRSERNRVYAFRRVRLIKTLADSADVGKPDSEACWAKQRSGIIDDLGWSELSENYVAILDQLRPLATAIRGSLSLGQAHDGSTIAAELDRFEKWFEEKHGTPFYVLYDQYVPEVPVVDF